ncbi:MAG: LytTR family DNA-binding domain-containing protein [Eubacterium sp.]
MQIALCDDEKSALQFLKKTIEDYCKQKNLTTQIDCFSCGEDFLKTEKHYDIVFMDIYLPGINGIETIKEIFITTHPQVVFTTTSTDHAVEAFNLSAIHYLVKPFTQKSVEEALNRYWDRMNTQEEDILIVKSGPGFTSIPTSTIIYIEVFNKISTIHTTKNNIQTYTSLDALFEQLDPNCFMKAQRSFIVNMQSIEVFFSDHIVLQNTIEISLSRNNRAALKEQYQNFLFNLARKGRI